MEGCSKTTAGAGVAGLPDDPVLEILSRVPAKSVCRFKCVSKAWRDLIADPNNRKRLRHAMQGLFVQTYADELDDEELGKDDLGRIRFRFINLTAVRSVPLDIDPCFSFLTEMTGIKAFLLDSCNGLILFGQSQDPSLLLLLDGYIVCNPTTRQWSAVPACGSREAISHTYLAFDPVVSSHFHLVQLQIPDVQENVVSLHVYSSETGTWSHNQIDKQKEQGQLEGWHHQFTLDPLQHQCAFVNGFLHLIVWGSNVHHILAVDGQGKARRMITVPGLADGRHEHNFVCYFGQSQGHLHCMILESADKKNVELSTWVLQDYDTQEWVLKNTVNSLDVFGDMGGVLEFQVIYIHQDCNLVFIFDQLNYELVAYDMDRKEASVIATLEDDKTQSDFARYIPYFSESPALTNKY
jgi:F-box interacting protein